MNAIAGKIATSSMILLAEAVVRLVAVAAISFWIARQMGPSLFGVLNFASALTAILVGLADLGMEVPVTLRLTTATLRGRLLGTVLALRAGSGLLAYLIAAALIVAFAHSKPDTLVPSLIVSLGIIAAIPNALDYWFKARTSAAAPAMARASATVLSSAAKAVCLMLGLGLVALAWSIVLETVLVALGLWLAFRRSSSSARDRLGIDRSQLLPLLRDSRPYWYSGFAVLFYLKVDLVMLGYLSSTVETGIYGLAQKISEVLYVVPMALISSAFPSLARRFLGNPAAGEPHEQMLFDLAVGTAILAVLAGNVLARPLILGIFGPAYEPAVQIFHLHSLSCIAIAMNEARYRWMATLSLQRYAPVVTTLGIAINVAMNLVLIPMLGAKGAAITTVASYFVSGYFSSFLFKALNGLGRAQTRALWPWFRLWRVLRARHAHRLPA